MLSKNITTFINIRIYVIYGVSCLKNTFDKSLSFSSVFLFNSSVISNISPYPAFLFNTPSLKLGKYSVINLFFFNSVIELHFILNILLSSITLTSSLAFTSKLSTFMFIEKVFFFIVFLITVTFLWSISSCSLLCI